MRKFLFALRFAIRNLRRRPHRTLLMLVVFGISSAFLILVQGYFEAVNRQVMNAIVVLAGGHVSVYGISKPRFDRSYALEPNTDEIRKLVEGTLPSSVTITERVVGLTRAVAVGRAAAGLLTGVKIDEEASLRELFSQSSTVLRGDPVAALHSQRQIVLFESQAEKLATDVGESITLIAEMPNGRFNTVDLTVGAVLRDIGATTAFTSFAHIDAVRQLLGYGEQQVSKLLIYLDDPNASGRVLANIRKSLIDHKETVLAGRSGNLFQILMRERREKWKGVRQHVTTWKDESPELVWRITAARGLELLVCILLGALVAMGLANTMWAAVRERRREIGALRAIGAGRAELLLTIVLEAVLLSFFGALLGAGIGLAVARLCAGVGLTIEASGYRDLMLDSAVNFIVQWGHVLAVMVGSVIIAVLAAIWPAHKAAGLPPVMAISDAA